MLQKEQIYLVHSGSNVMNKRKIMLIHLLPTGSGGRGVLRVGSIPVAKLPLVKI